MSLGTQGLESRSTVGHHPDKMYSATSGEGSQASCTFSQQGKSRRPVHSGSGMRVILGLILRVLQRALVPRDAQAPNRVENMSKNETKEKHVREG